MKKKLLSSVLALCMMLSLLPAAALATDVTTTPPVVESPAPDPTEAPSAEPTDAPAEEPVAPTEPPEAPAEPPEAPAELLEVPAEVSPVSTATFTISRDPGTTGGTDCTYALSENTVTFGGTVDYYGADTAVGRNDPGCRVGVEIKPATQGLAETSTTAFYYQIGNATTWTATTASENTHTLLYYPLVSKATDTFTVKVSKDAQGTAPETFTIQLDSKTAFKGPAAQIGTTPYATLAAAITAATTGANTIVLLSDTALTEKITIDKDVTIDGKGCTVTGVAADAGVYFEIKGGTVAFKNMTLTNFGNTATTVGATGVFKIPGTAADSTVLNAENLTLKLFNRGGFDIRNGNLNATNCTVQCDNLADQRLTKGFLFGDEADSDSGTKQGDGTLTNCTVTGADSTYEGWSSNGVELQAGSEVTIKDCKITSMKGGISVARNFGKGAAKLTVENSTVEGVDYALRVFQSSSTSSAVQGTSAAVTVDSGTFTGDVRVSVKDNEEIAQESKIILKGGAYSVDPSKFVDDETYHVEKAGDKFIVKSGPPAFSAAIDTRGNGSITATPFTAVKDKTNVYEATVSGTVDMRTYAITDKILQADFAGLVADARTQAAGRSAPSTIDAKYVKGTWNLVFADIDFRGPDGEKLVPKAAGKAGESAVTPAPTKYTIAQYNPGMAYAYSDDTSLKAGVKSGTGSPSQEMVDDGYTFIFGDNTKTAGLTGLNENVTQKQVIFTICYEGKPTTTFIIHNEIKFSETQAPEADAPVAEVKPIVTEDGKAAATVDANVVTETKVEAAKAQGTLVIDASATSSTALKEANITINSNVVSSIKTAGVSAEVKTPVGTVTLSPAAMAKMAEANANAVLSVVKEANPSATSGAIAEYSISVKKSDGQPIEMKELATPITLSFTIDSGLANPVLLYKADGGALSQTTGGTTYDKTTGIITGTTSHLSTFVVSNGISSTNAANGIGKEITVTVTSGRWVTAQITKGNSNTFLTKEADNGTVTFSVAADSTVTLWETVGSPIFTSTGINNGKCLSTFEALK